MGGGGILEDIVNATTQFQTGGLVGFENGSFSTGTGKTTELLKKGGKELIVNPIKDITGAKAAEEANKDARARFEQQKVKADEQRAESKAQSAREQLLLSRSAGAARGGVSLDKGSQKTASRFSSLGGDEQDFLGL